MRIFNRNKGFRIFYFVLALLSFTHTNAGNFQADSPDFPVQKKVKLKNDARANGYSVTFRRWVCLIEAVKEDVPDTKKLIERLNRLLYQCSLNGVEMPLPATFNRGNSLSSKMAVQFPLSPRCYRRMNRYRCNKLELILINPFKIY